MEFAGTLRERVMIERAGGAGDGAGGSETVWLPVARAWAAIAVERPGPGVEAERRSRRPRYAVTLRDREGVGLDCRIVCVRGALKVLGVTRDPLRPGTMELAVEEMER